MNLLQVWLPLKNIKPTAPQWWFNVKNPRWIKACLRKAIYPKLNLTVSHTCWQSKVPGMPRHVECLHFLRSPRCTLQSCSSGQRRHPRWDRGTRIPIRRCCRACLPAQRRQCSRWTKNRGHCNKRPYEPYRPTGHFKRPLIKFLYISVSSCPHTSIHKKI